MSNGFDAGRRRSTLAAVDAPEATPGRDAAEHLSDVAAVTPPVPDALSPPEDEDEVEFSVGTGLGELIDVDEGRRRLEEYARQCSRQPSRRPRS